MCWYVKCSKCGKSVSNELDRDVVVRAYVECPECVESDVKETDDLNYKLKEIIETVDDHVQGKCCVNMPWLLKALKELQ